jgi:hypothetical protein
LLKTTKSGEIGEVKRDARRISNSASLEKPVKMPRNGMSEFRQMK